ncbi:glycosyl transferase family 2 [Candidatus Magnetobacterium bavaricum]|uniref:Glycosyl transferase family 2 n=1 Tax=Candidatus Magnetobacterium bavaricum TaxID=29290 RepID=A0A0F3GXY2_9BACT|nr:glycosyl transferase family 2 [Candidatus Magnetobacterium bavaricum]
MKIAITIGVYNEEENIGRLLDSLLNQTKKPDEIIIVDDGSVDRTGEIIKSYADRYSIVRYMYQENAGPATARNRAWKSTEADICVFTDGDCIATANWLEELLKPFSDETVAATGGTYETLNASNALAAFIGLEIDWKYMHVQGDIDVHGAYNLAVRRHILEKIGGFKEKYKKPSAEDWDLTYMISDISRIVYVSTAVVGHYHPEDFPGYMKNQVMRAYDRVQLYRDHANRKQGDTYTGKIIKYQILASGAFLPSLVFVYPFFPYSVVIPLLLFSFMLFTAFIPFGYYIRRDVRVALLSIPVHVCRNFAWLTGLIKGYIKYGI